MKGGPISSSDSRWRICLTNGTSGPYNNIEYTRNGNKYLECVRDSLRTNKGFIELMEYDKSQRNINIYTNSGKRVLTKYYFFRIR